MVYCLLRNNVPHISRFFWVVVICNTNVAANVDNNVASSVAKNRPVCGDKLVI